MGEDIKPSVIGQFGRQISAGFGLKPGNEIVEFGAVRCAEVAARAGFDRGEGFSGPTVEIQKAVVGERTRDGHGGHPAKAPQFFALEIVTDGEARANGDDFSTPGVFPDVGARPACLAIGALDVDRTISAPDLLTGILIECRDELLFLVVVDDDDEVIDKSG